MIEPVPQPEESAARPVAGPRSSLSPRAARAAIQSALRAGPAALVMRPLSIPSASVVFMAAFLISAVLGIVRQVLINAQFGTGDEVSAFYAAFRLPDTIGNFIAGGALAGAMIPVLLMTERTEGPEAERHLANLVLTGMLVVVIPLTLVSIILAPVFVSRVLVPGFDAETNRLTITLTQMMLLQLPIPVITTVAIAVMNSRNQFVLTALGIISHNVALIVGILVARVVPGVGIYGPTIGILIDAIIQMCIMLPGLRYNGFRLRPAWDLGNRRLREVIRLLIPNGLSLAVNYAGMIVDTAFASLALQRQPGALAAVHNAFLLVGLPIRLLGMAVGQSVFPRLAGHAAAHEWVPLRRTLLRALAATFGLAVPVMAGLILFGRPLIQILFERGRFDAAAGTLTYTALVAYIIALPAYISTEILTRGLIALYDTRTPLLTNTLQIAGRIGLISVLLDGLGVVAIPIAFAVTSTLEALLLGLVLAIKVRRRMRQEIPE